MEVSCGREAVEDIEGGSVGIIKIERKTGKMIKWIILMIAGLLLPVVHTEPVKQEYIVIERDYEGTILLDAETGKRYLRMDEGMYEINENHDWINGNYVED